MPPSMNESNSIISQNDKLYKAKLTFSDDTFIELQIPEWFARIDLTSTADIYRVMDYLRPFTDRNDFKLLETI